MTDADRAVTAVLHGAVLAVVSTGEPAGLAGWLHGRLRRGDRGVSDPAVERRRSWDG